MVYARESFAAVLPEVMPLLAAHWAEVAHYKDIPLDVDVDAYLAVEATGAFRVYTARDGQGRLVGYAAFFVRANGHYRGSLQAVQDVLFLETFARGQGGELVRYAEEQLAAEGVQVVYQHIKVATPRTAALMVRLGYEAVDTIFAKRLDRAVGD